VVSKHIFVRFDQSVPDSDRHCGRLDAISVYLAATAHKNWALPGLNLGMRTAMMASNIVAVQASLISHLKALELKKSPYARRSNPRNDCCHL